jgi:hypothetical protein
MDEKVDTGNTDSLAQNKSYLSYDTVFYAAAKIGLTTVHKKDPGEWKS